MTQFLPPNLLALFAPRDPVPFLPPINKHATHRKLPYTGVAQFLGEFEDPSETPATVRIETREERKERKRKEKQEQANYKLEQDLALWNPKKNPNATGNAFNTMFIARMIVLVKNQVAGKPRGYCFVEFEHERDMHAAVKHLNGKKIDGMRILTDIERGRTRPDWRPRRLGKGLGKNRQGPPDRFAGRLGNRTDEVREPPGIQRPSFGHRSFGREKDHGRKHRSRSRSRSHERDKERRRSRSRDRHRKYRSPDQDRGNFKRRRDRGEDMMRQYGEYGAEIRAEYNGDM